MSEEKIIITEYTRDAFRKMTVPQLRKVLQQDKVRIPVKAKKDDLLKVAFRYYRAEIIGTAYGPGKDWQDATVRQQRRIIKAIRRAMGMQKGK